jgi:hypothetical protein
MIHFEPRPLCFEPSSLRFGQPAEQDEDDLDTAGLPLPTQIRLRARRMAAIAEAKGILEHLPEPGCSTHAITSCRLDLTDVLTALLERLGPCDRMLIATLGYHRRNLKTLLSWLDTGAVRSLSLVASKFFRSHNGALWSETLEQLHQRGQRAACTDSHAKVVAMFFASGEKLSIEGSQNLCGNGSAREQFALIRHDELTEWHSRWIDDLLERFEGKDDGEDG